MSETYKSKKQLKQDLAVLNEMDKIEAEGKPVTALDTGDKVKPAQQ
jgi:hypothetical protein